MTHYELSLKAYHDNDAKLVALCVNHSIELDLLITRPKCFPKEIVEAVNYHLEEKARLLKYLTSFQKKNLSRLPVVSLDKYRVLNKLS